MPEVFRQRGASRGEAAGEPSRLVLTVPNVLSILRLVGSGVLLALAGAGRPVAFLWLFSALLITDWLDGRIAVLFNQRSILGARLDSLADAFMYGALLLGLALLDPDFIASESIIVSVMIGSYAISLTAALRKFGRLPAYHTWVAKSCWLFVSIGAAAILLDGPLVLPRLAMLIVTLTNVEDTIITLRLDRWRADVPSMFHVRFAARSDRPC